MIKIAYSPRYNYPVPDGHRFPMAKYDALPEQLCALNIVSKNAFFEPGMPEKSSLLRVHTAEYLQALESGTIPYQAQRRSGFIHTPELIEREKNIMQGTIECAEYAMKYGFAYNIAGGTHHAFADRGEGFCLLNDMAIAVRHLQATNKIKRPIIIDLDVHQGNGTASIFLSDDSVFTFSMHGKNNYPFIKEQSDLDIELQNGIGDLEYMEILEASLHRIFQIIEPDFIAYNAGVDVLQTDLLGKMALSMQGCKQRDELVFERAKKAGIPLVASSGGGYSKDLEIIVRAHCQTIACAQKIFFSLPIDFF